MKTDKEKLIELFNSFNLQSHYDVEEWKKGDITDVVLREGNDKEDESLATMNDSGE